MFNGLLKYGQSDRPYEEFGVAEPVLARTHLPPGGWRFGARLVDGHWRTIVQVDSLPYDILLPGLHMTQEPAVEEALRLSREFGGVPRVPEGQA